MKQIPLAIGPEQQPTFESYLSQANAETVAQLRALGPGAPPAYLWGPSGSGKSHLLRALADERRSAGGRAVLFDAGDAVPWELHEQATLVMVDHCDALDAQRQHGAFKLFVEAAAIDAQWVAAGRVPPVDLPLRDDLRTRLAWGHVFALHAPDESDTRAVLRREAERRGIGLGDGVLDYLLSRFERDLKSLMALFDRLDRYALSRQRALTVPLIRQMLNDDGLSDDMSAVA